MAAAELAKLGATPSTAVVLTQLWNIMASEPPIRFNKISLHFKDVPIQDGWKTLTPDFQKSFPLAHIKR